MKPALPKVPVLHGDQQDHVRGARQHNLKNITVEIPRNTLTVITGLSGSGKSSLAFDTIYAEGQRRYVETLSAYARQFLDQMERPDVDSIDGLEPGDLHRAEDYIAQPAFDSRDNHRDLRLFALALLRRSACRIARNCGKPISRQTADQIVQPRNAA